MKKITIYDVWVPPTNGSRELKKCNNDVIDEFSALVCKIGNKHMRDYCEILSLRTSVLNNIIKTYTGLSSNLWKDRLIMADAEWYLIETMLDLEEIAGRMLFKDAIAFNAFFKLRSGVTPTHFRSTHRIVETTYKITRL